jgi:hypothetical protein
LRVLLVEDDASIREGLNKLVNILGHRVHITQPTLGRLENPIRKAELTKILLQTHIYLRHQTAPSTRGLSVEVKKASIGTESAPSDLSSEGRD